MVRRGLNMEKKNKFSIGEISQLTGVTVRTLQYYDNIQLVPLEKMKKTDGDITQKQI